ncbi:hypothetical protein [Listeria ivanovii]|uniref:hypothetical protein n=1 Tax=Listeria ivanovii TaxID=1638 RepID=UPI0005128C53|nr:hypothetical protein [Listeria ivanovii]AIS62030.1 hypothetical protein JL53_04505 [Listeria ivanovii subsp. londoniensis]MBK1965601.1 hypothetical protein [Listeria ivanovii subsp. londoniensis]MBK1983426.1 hypothetical protein [Listeria ivanovii subsp. londoniensis]MBK1994768.1 hypothetical protein [Listeria ivanovii subsp. londoniensis]
MEDIIIPKEIKISDIVKGKTNLSPNNYKKIGVRAKRKVAIQDLLETIPFVRGTEPGASSYLKDLVSNVKFVRNSCIDKLNYTVQVQKSFFLNENKISYNENQLLQDDDVIVATDANIGDSAIFFNDDNCSCLLSSGMIKLNVKSNINKYYLFSFLKDSYFNIQLDSITPKGSTIRHSGSNLLECYIPFPGENDYWVIQIIENLTKNIIFSERRAQKIQEEIFSIFDKELETIFVEKPFIKASNLLSAKRIDAGFYSEEVQSFFGKIEQFPTGNKTLEELGYRIKRGPSLQKRDLGRSIKTEVFQPNYSLLIYPSDISDYGYIDKTIFLGAAGKVWFLEENDILFSAEGNVGKTFAICDNSLRFTTNIHGIIITPLDKENVNLKNTILISTFLNYMKKRGIMDKLSVGGQGGSFAVQYWDILKFPNIEDDTINKITELYFNDYIIHPFDFKKTEIDKLGIYEISKLRTICNSLLKLIINDIKTDTLKSKNFYIDKLKDI